MKTTKGPWTVSGKDTCVRSLETNEIVARANELADAYLIASSPDMFKTLVLIKDFLEITEARNPIVPDSPILKQVREVLRKATGEN